MPYIAHGRRKALDAYVDSLIAYIKQENFEGAYIGDVTYVLTRLLLGLFRSINGKLRYWQITAIRGILASVTSELHDRVFAPYEAAKCSESGDILEFVQYDLDLQVDEEPAANKTRGLIVLPDDWPEPEKVEEPADEKQQ